MTLGETGAPIRMWADPASVDEAVMGQLRDIANLPWTHGLAVMPDVHLGKGAAVGCVIAMRDAVCPAAVGVDIGCGMSAVPSSLHADDLPANLRKLRKRIEAAVPVGSAVHRSPVDTGSVPGTGDWDAFWRDFGNLHPGVRGMADRARSQLGTLGGGNHFIEVCLEQGGPDDGRVWLMLHSGSRGIGNELAQRHIDIASGLAHNADLPDRDLAAFLADTPQMRAYIHDVFWAQDYAARNRAIMLWLVKRALADTVRGARFDEPISCHHNYVAEETYDGVNLLVTRKGAIRAGAGELGIVPGSMGTGSYIVRGLGNERAFRSAAHGAGRRMSRNKARKTYSARDLAAQTRGVECRKDAGALDEIPAAYKDIDSVIEAQRDLVEVVTRLKQVVCVKG
ncbi:RtcB family protein [Haloechinothrix sp. YIM 98757]|uniref:3'-phosphate/5'-hydroxy nucleic acid ligase n=1 Tax=Haloechinothrix aidingensis TaxID=2752311 RepID=A0A838ADZ2_9PSEU|nr:RtcB family protein [Haloechinothrix aidingensis]MBA0127431.1 RtcB family protein [Haloechinothrix aidingensis]